MRFVFACVLAGAFAANANPNEQLIFAGFSARSLHRNLLAGLRH
jgi:hypothetical protein